MRGRLQRRNLRDGPRRVCVFAVPERRHMHAGCVILLVHVRGGGFFADEGGNTSDKAGAQSLRDVPEFVHIVDSGWAEVPRWAAAKLAHILGHLVV